MRVWKEVESTEKPLTYEENNGIVFIRKDIELVEGDGENPDMYHYKEKRMTAAEYLFYEDYEKLQSDVDYLAMEMGVEL